MKLFFFTLVLLALGQKTFADAMITSIQGTVQVLHVLKDSKDNSANKVLFEGQKYLSEKAKVGAKVQAGDVVMSNSDSKAKLIFEHGDLFVVGSGSALTIPQSQGGKDKESTILYGNLRAVINKDGPLSGLKIRTPSAVAGIRGTDFFVSFNSTSSQTELKVLRGEVNVQPETKGPTPSTPIPSETPTRLAEVTVKTGEVVQIAVMAKADTPTADTHSGLTSTVKTFSVSDFNEVTSESTVHNSDSNAGLSADMLSAVKEAEHLAVLNVIQDVTRYNGAAGKKMAEANITSIEEANQFATHELAAKVGALEEPVAKKSVASSDATSWGQWFSLMAETLDTSSFASGVSSNSSITPGFAGGASYTIRLGDSWKLKSGLGLVYNSFNLQQSTATGSNTGAYSSMYAAVPLDFEFSASEKYRILLGATPMAKLFSSLNSSASGTLAAQPAFTTEPGVTFAPDIGFGFGEKHWSYYFLDQPQVILNTGANGAPATKLNIISFRAEYDY